MQNQEVANAVEIEQAAAVELVDVCLFEATVRKQAHEPAYAGLNEMDTGRLQRFHEAAGQSQGDAVPAPELLAPAGGEFQQPGLVQRGAVQIVEQGGDRFVVAHVAAAKDVAVADAMLQRYAPLPAGIAGGRAGIGTEGIHPLARHGNRPVARQPVRPVFVVHAERLSDQQAPETGAIDEKLAGHALAVFQRQRFDETAVGVPFHVRDFPLDAGHAQLFAEFPEIERVQGRVEVVGVDDALQRTSGQLVDEAEAIRQGGGLVDRIVPEPAGVAFADGAQPILVKIALAQTAPDLAESVHVAIAGAAPVAELYAQLEGALRPAQEIVFVQAEHPVEIANGRNRGLAHSHRADLLGFHEADIDRGSHGFREQRRRHPSGRAASGDNDLLDWSVIRHFQKNRWPIPEAPRRPSVPGYPSRGRRRCAPP